jgi:hypothetical protein
MSARPDLCGGQPAMAVPTAIIYPAKRAEAVKSHGSLIQQKRDDGRR